LRVRTTSVRRTADLPASAEGSPKRPEDAKAAGPPASRPSPGNNLTAGWALAVRRHLHLPHVVSAARHQRLMTAGAVRICEIADLSGKVAGVDVAKTRGPGDRRGTLKHRGRRILRVQHLVVGVKCGDVPWNVDRDAGNKRRQSLQFILGVIKPRDQKRD